MSASLLRPRFPSLGARACLLLLGFGARLVAHPIPDLPVRSSFQADGTCLIEVEVDPRCFEPDPNMAPSVLFGEFQQGVGEDRRASWKAQAKEFVARSVEFFFEPQGAFHPEFEFNFTGQEGAPLKNADDIVVLSGAWRTRLPEGMKGYRIRATEGGKLCVLFLNTLQGQAVRRIAVLFPGETSFLLDPAAAPPGPADEEAAESAPGGDASGWLGRFAIPAAAAAAGAYWWIRRRIGRHKAPA